MAMRTNDFSYTFTSADGYQAALHAETDAQAIDRYKSEIQPKHGRMKKVEWYDLKRRKWRKLDELLV